MFAVVIISRGKKVVDKLPDKWTVLLIGHNEQCNVIVNDASQLVILCR